MRTTCFFLASTVAAGATVTAVAKMDANSAAGLQMNDPTTASETAKSYYDNQTPITPDECDHYCGVWYGLAHSGFSSAAEHWAQTPDSYKLSAYEEGALAFWTGGSSGAGHCTIGSPESDTIFSTDYPTKGFVGHTSVDEINSHWTSLQFAGWARAYFPNGVTDDGLFLNDTKHGNKHELQA
mmetsp:Transcript_36624/g.53796  ORF Transcript_36624/g.53796 Transcript_36624/m.53796 type:complete len:182 (-) Transcript_36624:110-655(-)